MALEPEGESALVSVVLHWAPEQEEESALVQEEESALAQEAQQKVLVRVQALALTVESVQVQVWVLAL